MDTKDPITVDREFLRALVAREFDSVEQILADDFVLIDLSGAVVPKEGFLGGLRSGDLSFGAIQPEDVSVHVYDYTALVRGRTAMRGSFKGAPFAFNSRYTHTYVQQMGCWKMVAAQGTPIAG
jgi:ketosteroid isomerase-like protein